MLMSLLLMQTPSTKQSGGSGPFHLLLLRFQPNSNQDSDPARGRGARGQQRAEEDAAEGAGPVEWDLAGGRDGQVHQLRGHRSQGMAVPGHGQCDEQRDVWGMRGYGRGYGPHHQGLQGAMLRGLAIATAAGRQWAFCRRA